MKEFISASLFLPPCWMGSGSAFCPPVCQDAWLSPTVGSRVEEKVFLCSYLTFIKYHSVQTQCARVDRACLPNTEVVTHTGTCNGPRWEYLGHRNPQTLHIRNQGLCSHGSHTGLCLTPSRHVAHFPLTQGLVPQKPQYS